MKSRKQWVASPGLEGTAIREEMNNTHAYVRFYDNIFQFLRILRTISLILSFLSSINTSV